MPKVNTVDTNIVHCCSLIYKPAVVKSFHPKKKFVVSQTASSGIGNERERERERERFGKRGGGGRGSGVPRDELENELAGRSTLNQRHM